MVRYAVKMLGDRGIAVVDAATGKTLVAAEDVSDATQRSVVEAFFGEVLETSSAAKPPSLVRARGHSFANVGGRPNEHVLHLQRRAHRRAVLAGARRRTRNVPTRKCRNRWRRLPCGSGPTSSSRTRGTGASSRGRSSGGAAGTCASGRRLCCA